MKRYLKDLMKRIFFQFHKFGIRMGWHILPVHYYSPIPNIIELQKTQSIWAKKSTLPGVNIDLDEQVQNLKTICMPYQCEYVGYEANKLGFQKKLGPGYGYIESQALHAVVRHYKPRRIIEAGSGVSTLCMLTAIEMNERDSEQVSSIICVEPYPSSGLRALRRIHLIPKMVQCVAFDLFEELEAGDMLFIDSSHTVKPGSDVNYLILEVLPRLHSGVIVHFHDIYLPYDYAPHLFHTFLHWTETSLLRAFLIHNPKIKTIFCLSHLHYDRRQDLLAVFPEYNPGETKDGLYLSDYTHFQQTVKHFPSSIYLQIN